MGFFISKGGPNNQHNLDEVGRILHELFASVFAEDNLIVFDRNLTFLEDKPFASAVKEFAHTAVERELSWRLHITSWFARQVFDLPGDFVECGVLRGLTSAVLCRVLNFERHQGAFWLFDTFNGLAARYASADEFSLWNQAYRSPEFAGLFSSVQQRFAEYPNVKVIQGIVPDVFKHQIPQAISFLHIDMNAALAERLALETLYPLVIPGGVILLDDFGWKFHRAQMEAARDFFDQQGLKVMELPTGQGVVMKPR